MPKTKRFPTYCDPDATDDNYNDWANETEDGNINQGKNNYRRKYMPPESSPLGIYLKNQKITYLTK